DKTNPKAVSSLILENRVIQLRKREANRPVNVAPIKSQNGFFDPVNKNAKQIPGSAAWASTSPINPRFRKKAKLPNTPLLIPSKVVPARTHKALASRKSSNT